MRKINSALAALVTCATMVGCASTDTVVDLKKVANNQGMINITTGDGTFENYQATGYHTGTEIGLAFGIPFFGKFFEVYPSQDNEEMLEELAKDAKESGANAMINVTPPTEFYLGLPFIIFGLYWDRTDGTGIAVN